MRRVSYHIFGEITTGWKILHSLYKETILYFTLQFYNKVKPNQTTLEKKEIVFMRKPSLKSIGALALAAMLSMGVLVGCGGTSDSTEGSTGTINVISREDGSGTRSAFVELFGVCKGLKNRPHQGSRFRNQLHCRYDDQRGK